MSNKAKKGDQVQVHYIGKLIDGSVFDSSAGQDPLAFALGSGMVIEGFDKGVIGMKVGEKKILEISVDQAYGPVLAENILKIPRKDVPSEIPLEVGAILNMHQDGTGQVMQVAVAELTTEYVTLDANHPLTGKDLIFDIELVGIG